jgi:tRNA pseudouridine38-40 synthase
MERYQIILAYDGTHFQGFQRQGRARTVQAEVENALRHLGWQGRAILFAGRTDRGVHASGQVIAFDLEWAHSPETLGRALNAHLPDDVAVKAVMLAAPGFHPRFDARARCYHYRLYCQPERDPLRDRYAWRVWPAPQLHLLAQAASLLVGRHDFAAFGSPTRMGGSTVRQVLAARWHAQADEFHFEVWANAFLYRMVRRMTWAQVAFAQGSMELARLSAALDHQSPLPAGLAAPQGLTLVKVLYDGQEEAGQAVLDTLSVSE